MPRTRRTALARRLAATTALSYQQALTLLEQHTKSGAPLPRTDAELAALAAASATPPGRVGRALGAVLPGQTVAAVLALLEAVRPGTPVASTWPAHPTQTGEQQRQVVAVHRPGDPVPPGAALDPAEAAIALTDPDGGAALWLSLPTDPATDRPERWRVAAGAEPELTYLDRDGNITGWYRFRLPMRDVADAAAPLTFTISYSDMGRCPQKVFSVSHYLPTGQCAHQEPTCPTCGGVGVLSAGERHVPCAAGAEMPTRAPVCGGTGRWSGDRAR